MRGSSELRSLERRSPAPRCWFVGMGQMAVTHGDGSFHISVPTAQSYTLRVERLGYRTVTVELDGLLEEAVAVELEVAALTLPGFVVTGAVTERAANETLRPTTVFAAEELQRRLAATVAETLDSEPGLAVTSMGPGSAHPVIRGLSGDRILMLEDGQRTGDVFNSGADHATALDAATARRIEVIRGPGAILYGSNALGGVINVVRDEVPPAVPHHPTGAVSLRVQYSDRCRGRQRGDYVRLDRTRPPATRGVGGGRAAI